MIKSIQVEDVMQYNTCSGKVYICVSSNANHLIKSYYSLYSSYMFYENKLLLASVKPGDIVNIHENIFSTDITLAGEYMSVNTYSNDREAICKCGQKLVSDGYDIYCVNVECYLTLIAKIRRLSDTNYFPEDVIENSHGPIHGPVEYLFIPHDNKNVNRNPFQFLNDPEFWGYDKKSLEMTIYENTKLVRISNFLVEHNLMYFLESKNYKPVNIFSLNYLFEVLNNIKTRRDIRCHIQNQVMAKFIWSLGIDSLPASRIEDLLRYELYTEFVDNPFYEYIHILTNPSRMILDLGFYKLEAYSICNEVKNRWYDFKDIFEEYTDVANVKLITQDFFRNR